MQFLPRTFHPLIPLIAFLPLSLIPLVSATPLPASKPTLNLIHSQVYPTDLCSNTTTTSSIPHLWSVQVHSITYSTPGFPNSPGGTASFSVTNSLTNSTAEINCVLRFDSLCDVKLNSQEDSGNGDSGVLDSGVLDIHLQVLIEVAYVTVVETVSCGKKSVNVGGMAEVYLGCDFEASPRRCWGEEGGWVDAEVLGETPGGGTGG